MALDVTAGTLPDPEVIRQTAQDVIQRPEYRFEAPENVISLREVIEAIIRTLEWVLQPITGLFSWLFSISPWLSWGVMLLLCVLLALIVGHLVYTFAVVFRQRKRSFELSDDVAPGMRPETLELQAQEAVTAGDYIQAVRLLFRACLLRLEQAEDRPLRRGLTNREYLRRYSDTLFYDPLVPFVNMIDHKWYGGGECRVEDYELCADAHAKVRRAIREGEYAQRS